MKFEEQFPSFELDEFGDESSNLGFTEEDNTMSIRWIKKNCLDKAKVREKILAMPEVDTEGGRCVVCSKSYLIEELGL